MLIWREFRATNAEVTCLWCGKPLAYWLDKEWSQGQRGYAGTGHFCSLRCAFNFAERMVELGRRFEPLKGPARPEP